jgi:hypothetical protein
MSSADVATLEAKIEALGRLIQEALKPALPRATYTPKEVAAMLGMKERWVADQCAARLIPTISKRPYLIPAGWVEEARRGPSKRDIY